jgi:NAD(P)-dependent dehydrogenase (short-subunit alcohol dehydrogenase family)
MMLAYAGRPGADLAGAVTTFGADWFYVLVPAAALLGALVLLARRAPAPAPRGFLRRASHGAGAVSGLPPWCAGPLVLAIGAFVFAVQGFIWDVAWHITIGRDEFLFSPPHVCLLLGIGLLALAGLTSVSTATRDGAEVGWRVDRWRVPMGGAALLVAGTAALVAFGVDELWHWAYGLDVTMWSPPHLTMISCAAFSPMAAWLLLAEAGPHAGHAAVRRHLRGFLAAAVLVGLSAWQLEFDLGVPQWQHLYHPVLVALAGGFALTAARAALGRGGALLVVGWFVVVRGALALLTVGAWGLSVPRFVPYVAGALAVEAAFRVTRGRTSLVQGLAAGLGMATVGLAGAWVFTHLWAWHPWQLAMLPRAWVAVSGAVAAAVLGSAFGRALGHRPTGLRGGAVALALTAVALVVAVPLPRHVPAAEAQIRTTPAGEGLVHVEVTVSPPVTGADWFEVMSWQGDGFQSVPLAPAGGDRWVTRSPVPVTGEWKSMVRLARGPALGAVPISLPADPEIGASAVPVAPERSAPFTADSEVLLREATDGPAWPGVIGYTFVGASILAVVALLVAGTAGLDRRRRAHGWRRGPGSLEGRRVVLTGASGGIGTAARNALEAQGARVVGIDLVGDGAHTLAADVRDPAAVRAAIAEAAGRLGGLDAVIANAGIGRASDATAMPGRQERDVLDVNFYGAWHTVAAALEHMGHRGQVVVIGSGLAVATVPFSAAYTAGKRALTGYADVLRLETHGRLSVSTVQPAYIRTPIHDIPAAQGVSLDGAVRCESVADAAAAIVTACETGRRELGSSPATTAQLWMARRAPAITDRFIRWRWRAAGGASLEPEPAGTEVLPR